MGIFGNSESKPPETPPIAPRPAIRPRGDRAHRPPARNHPPSEDGDRGGRDVRGKLRHAPPQGEKKGRGFGGAPPPRADPRGDTARPTAYENYIGGEWVPAAS